MEYLPSRQTLLAEFGEATQAAIRAGYNPKTARQIGYENLRKPHIRAEIDRLAARHFAKCEVDIELIKQVLAEVIMADYGTFFNDKGKPKRVQDLTAAQRRAVAGVIFRRDGTVKPFRFNDRIRAADLLAKLLGHAEAGAGPQILGINVPITLNIAFVESDGNGRPLQSNGDGGGKRFVPC